MNEKFKQNNNKKIRVLEIVGNAKIGGVVSSVLNYYRHLNNEFVIDFVTYGASQADSEINSLGGRVFYVSNFIKFPIAMKELDDILKRNKYDIVHSHLTSLSVFPLRVACKNNVPVRICHAHSTSGKVGDHASVKRFLRKFSTTYSNYNLACGQVAGRWLYGKQQFEVINNAIELDKYVKDNALRQSIRAKYNIADDTKVVGFCGRFCKQKNVFFLLKAFAKIKRKDIVLMMIGDGELKDKLQNYANRLGINNRVIWTGATKDTIAHYNAMDLLVLPSLYEGLPMVGVEAQACGINCIFSNKITPEVDVLDGNIFLPLKAKLWARTIEHKVDNIVVDNQATDKMSQNYGIDTQAQHLADIYHKLYDKYCNNK